MLRFGRISVAKIEIFLKNRKADEIQCTFSDSNPFKAMFIWL